MTLPLPLDASKFKWPYNGILNDLRAAIAGKANFLAALGLLVYTEVVGRWILQSRGTTKPKNDASFYWFYEKYMGKKGAEKNKVYKRFRHGLAHGDLQNGNALVDKTQLRLVDYDGMFVPAMGGRMLAIEAGPAKSQLVGGSLNQRNVPPYLGSFFQPGRYLRLRGWKRSRSSSIVSLPVTGLLLASR